MVSILVAAHPPNTFSIDALLPDLPRVAGQFGDEGRRVLPGGRGDVGAQAVLDQVSPNAQAIEYRHVPDPHAVQRELLPVIERLRAGLPLKETSA